MSNVSKFFNLEAGCSDRSGDEDSDGDVIGGVVSSNSVSSVSSASGNLESSRRLVSGGGSGRRRDTRGDSPRGRAFCFTLNNYTPEELDSLKNVGAAHVQYKVKYIVFGEEVGSNGTPHLQGYINFTNAKRLQEVHLIPGLERGHFEVARGTAKQNFDYTTKDGQFFEYGAIPAQGKRSDIFEAVETMKRAKSLVAVAEEHPVAYVKYAGGFAKLLQALDCKKRDFKTKVWWFHGPTGSGKSRLAYEIGNLSTGCYSKMPRNKWWDGYSHEDVVIVDDYRKDLCTFHELLALTDRYPYQVEMKGSSIQFRSKIIIFTSPLPPKEMWDGRTEEDIGQLMRRVDQVLKFPLNPIDLMVAEGMKDLAKSFVGEIPVETRGLDLSNEEGIVDSAALVNRQNVLDSASSYAGPNTLDDFEFDVDLLDTAALAGVFDV